MPDNIIHINEDALKGQLSELVRGTVEETLNILYNKRPTESRMQAVMSVVKCDRIPGQDTRIGSFNQSRRSKTKNA